MGLPVSSGSLNMSQSQAQWDAIAEIKTNSPFAVASDSGSGSGVGTALDAMLAGYSAQTDAISAQQSGSGDSLAAVTVRVRAAQQSTIDLFA